MYMLLCFFQVNPGEDHSSLCGICLLGKKNVEMNKMSAVTVVWSDALSTFVIEI